MHYYTCPICGYAEMPYPPARHEICPCCGTEFGYDDFTRSHRDLRNNWLAQGGPWFSPVHTPPNGWNPFVQVLRAGYEFDGPIPDPIGADNTIQAAHAGVCFIG